MSLKNLKKVSEKVEWALQKHPLTRNNDAALVCCVYNQFYGITKDSGFFDVIRSIKKKEVPPFESIRRCRQKLQESGKYLATNKVKEGRSELEEDVRGQISGWWK